MDTFPAVLVILGAMLISTAAAPETDAAAEVRARLAATPRPWTEKMHRVTQEEYEETLRFWAERHPDRVTVEEAGKSVKGMSIFLVRVTDSAVTDTDKQVCLVTSLHGGPERSGTSAALHLIEWLISDDPLAAETRRRQVVLVMPIINPESYFVTDRFLNANGIDPYTGTGQWDVATLTFKKLDQCPEIAAFLQVVDAYRPEVHVDLHGVGLQEYSEEQLGDRTMRMGHTMFEIVGSAYSNYALRPWDWRITEAMIEAGNAVGASADRFEADAQRCFWGTGQDALADRLWVGRPRFYTSQYAYAKYHTMVMAYEVGYEECTIARLKGLLEIGNTVWDGECTRGYPVDRMLPYVGHYVTAWGTTAEERRRSRAELWMRQGTFGQGLLYPQFDGRDMTVWATTAEARALVNRDRETFLTNCAKVEGVDVDAVRAFVEDGPEVMLYPNVPGPGPAADAPPIEHGIGFRIRIPYLKPKLVDLRLNGHLLEESATDGYQAFVGNGYTHVQVNVPPEKAREMGIYIITCAYVPDVKRSFGWSPPKEVTDRLETKPE